MYALYGADDEKYHDEALALGERILQKSTDERQRSSAMQIHMSREVLLSYILEGEEGTEQNLQLLLDGLEIIERAEFKLCQKVPADL